MKSTTNILNSEMKSKAVTMKILLHFIQLLSKSYNSGNTCPEQRDFHGLSKHNVYIIYEEGRTEAVDHQDTDVLKILTATHEQTC